MPALGTLLMFRLISSNSTMMRDTLSQEREARSHNMEASDVYCPCTVIKINVSRDQGYCRGY